jgi:hypothetical protein
MAQATAKFVHRHVGWGGGVGELLAARARDGAPATARPG